LVVVLLFICFGEGDAARGEDGGGDKVPIVTVGDPLRSFRRSDRRGEYSSKFGASRGAVGVTGRAVRVRLGGVFMVVDTEY